LSPTTSAPRAITEVASGRRRKGKALIKPLHPNPPKISIVLPTYNGRDYLRQSIRSVVDQTERDWELIIVDDCSTEPVIDIVREFNDSRIHYLRNATNCRLPISLNRGFAVAAGTYLTWTSDDNYYDPRAIEIMSRALDRHPDLGLVYSTYTLIDSEGNHLGRRNMDPAICLAEGYTVGACFLYRREVYEKVGGYDPSAELVEDYEYWLRVHNRFKMGLIDEDLYFYRLHDTSLTSSTNVDNVRRMQAKCRKHVCSLRRKLDIRLYRGALKWSGIARKPALAVALLPVRLLSGVIIRGYQKGFHIANPLAEDKTS